MQILVNFRVMLLLTAALALLAVAACSGAGNGSRAPEGVAETPASGGANTDVESGIEDAARKLLAEEVGEGDLVLESSKSVQWSDAGLGCPQEGMMYAQVITPGHELVFSLAGVTYAVHSNDDGSNMVICDSGQ